MMPMIRGNVSNPANAKTSFWKMKPKTKVNTGEARQRARPIHVTSGLILTARRASIVFDASFFNANRIIPTTTLSTTPRKSHSGSHQNRDVFLERSLSSDKVLRIERYRSILRILSLGGLSRASGVYRQVAQVRYYGPLKLVFGRAFFGMATKVEEAVALAQQI